MTGRKAKRGRRGPRASAGSLTLQYAGADNVKTYTTINITTSSLGVPTDRPVRINWVRIQFSSSYDHDATSDGYVPLIQYEAMAPSGSSTPRLLFRSPPSLVPTGPIKTTRFKVPNAGFFQYDTAQTIVLKMIISSSSDLAVTFNIFCNITIDYKSYQGLSLAPLSRNHLTQHKRDDDDEASSSFSRLSLNNVRRAST